MLVTSLLTLTRYGGKLLSKQTKDDKNVVLNSYKHLCYSIEASEICNFADDNTIYALSHCAEAMIAKLEIDFYNTPKWFDSNSIVANPSKFKVMSLGLKKDQHLVLEINGDVITNSREENYLVLHLLHS